MTDFNAANKGARTEAEADVAVVLPYLRSVGIGAGQLRAQRSFSLRLGRGIVSASTERSTIGGRFDYLVTRDDGRPLFVVEVKAPDEELTDDDRDQGISYARLVHPIAPVVLLTNSRETRIFDTITKELIGESDVGARATQPRVLSSDDDLRVRCEALEHFVGYSPENVAALSAAQCRVRMRSLRAVQGEEQRKYVAEAYVRREEVRRAVAGFLESDKTTFALVGESGTGKSNEMCALADEYGREHIVLFFSGSDLSGSLTGTLADEFNWHLSEALPLQQICRRLAGLAERSGRPALIVLDAVDEVEIPRIAGELSELATRLAELGGRIRLLVSAKLETWSQFVMTRGGERGITDGLYVPHTNDVEATGARAGIPASFHLKQFVNTERDDAIALYARVFALPDLDSREWTPAMRAAACDPFMLRVIAEVTTQRGALPRDPNEQEIVRSYVDAKLERTADPATSRVELTAVARAIVEQNSRHGPSTPTQSDEEAFQGTAEEGTVLNLLRLPGNAAVARELVAFGVLTRVVDDAGRTRLAFGYDRVRDFVVATRVFCFQELDAKRFEQAAEQAFDTPIGMAALRWFLPFTSVAQRPAFVNVARRRLARVVRTYDAIRNLIAPKVRAKMDPQKATEIGVAFSANLQTVHFGLAFFRRRDNSVSDVVEDAENFKFGGRPTSVPPATIVSPWDLGNAQIRGGFWYLAAPERFAAEYAREEILRLAKEGQLNEATDRHLLRERVLALTSVHEQVLGFPQSHGVASRADRELVTHLIPLDLVDLDRRVQEALAVARYRDERMDAEGHRQRASAAPGQTILTWSMSFSSELVTIFARRAQMAVANGERFTAVARPDDLRALAEAVESLRADESAIPGALLPPPDAPAADRYFIFESVYSDVQLSEFCKALFSKAIVARDAIVAGTFTAPLAGAIPRSQWSGEPGQRLLIVFERRDRADPLSRWGGTLMFALARRSAGAAGPVHIEAIVDPGTSTRVVRYGPTGSGAEPSWLVDTDAGTVEVGGWRRFAFSTVFSPAKRRPFVVRGDASAANFAPVRSAAYDFLERDLEGLSADAILAALKASN